MNPPVDPWSLDVAIQAMPAWFWTITAFLFGAVVGSFLNVCIHRLPRGHSVVSPRSRCYACGKSIRWFDNLPIVSYLLLGGKCRDCGAPFSIRYWMVEWLTAFLFIIIWRSFPPAEATVYTIFACGLIVATFVDFEHYIIPNEITLGGIAIGIICSGLVPSLQDEIFASKALLKSLLGAAAGYFILWGVVEAGKCFLGIKKLALPEPTQVTLTSEGILIDSNLDRWEDIFSRESDVLSFQGTQIRYGEKTLEKGEVQVNYKEVKIGDEVLKLEELPETKATTELIYVPREAMGFGDVKFLAAIGAFLGYKGVIFTIFASSLIGSLAGLFIILIGKREWGLKLPYGPYLALAAMLWLFGGAHWYDIFIAPGMEVLLGESILKITNFIFA